MLLVHDDERKARKIHAFLEQRMRADHESAFLAGSCVERCLPRLRTLATGQQQRFDTEWRKPAREVLEVLLGEQFGGRHQGRLAARLDRKHRGICRDNGLA